ncbi:hypothetical protein [Helicobacter pametensis]|uniref:hypothetical protein n=1 Tax=Helicobacter pametensis TaxID=95149 RepID=UPI0004897679|nr:hypothetical protein [Helicobacter pametensis]
MIFWTLVYTLAICSVCVFFVRFLSLQVKTFAFVLCAVFANLPFILGLSVVEWLDSVLGRPSLFLFFLSLSACFVVFFAPKEEILPLRSKAFIIIFGFVLFLGNLNLLWGFDLFSLGFEARLIIAFGILLFAISLDLFLGILYLLCLLVFAFGLQGNLFTYLIDVCVWLYAIFGLVISLMDLRRKARH